ncbi:hypothetical protein [Streptomyces sp. A5-4]|uniref:hypothetical protein n=1 Tax=Streptomyces sp. A5-4 TaxID=3384771 RepID=UPI003DA991D5
MMTLHFRKAAQAVAVASLTVTALGTTTAATAAPTAPAAATQSCPSNGHLQRGWSCTSLSNGQLHHRKGTNHVANTYYEKTSGGKTNVKLGINAGAGNKYKGSVSIKSGQTKTGSWSVDYCKVSLGLMVSGGTYQTPPTHCNT